MGKSQFSFTEKDIIQSDGADLYGPQAQGVGQEDDGIGSDIVWSGKRKGGKELLHLLGTQELGRLLFTEQTRSHKQRSEVFLQDPALPVKVCQESPQMRTIDAAGRASDLESCQELIKVLDLQLGKENAVLLKVVVERGQKAFDLPKGVERSLVGLLPEIGVKRIGQIDQPSWDGQRFGDFAIAVKKTG